MRAKAKIKLLKDDGIFRGNNPSWEWSSFCLKSTKGEERTGEGAKARHSETQKEHREGKGEEEP